MSETINIKTKELADLVEKAAQKGASEGANAVLRADAREIVIEALTMLGLDTSDPVELQKDFHHLRSSRKTTENIGSETVKIGVKTVIGAVVIIALLGLKSYIEGVFTGTP